MSDALAEPFADQGVIRRLLNESRTWAFVGLGDNPHREVYNQARLMQQRGKTIIPVHPSGETVLGEAGRTSLRDVGPVDVVGVYRRAEFAGEVV
ncbi:CoA-binding protein, partial [Actinomadura adrarensis]